MSEISTDEWYTTKAQDACARMNRSKIYRKNESKYPQGTLCFTLPCDVEKDIKTMTMMFF